MQSDPWWSFAMAINVYMVFFMSYPLHDFHRHLWLYCLICFGIPAIPAFICLFYIPNGQRIYGNATVSSLAHHTHPGCCINPDPGLLVMVLDR